MCVRRHIHRLCTCKYAGLSSRRRPKLAKKLSNMHESNKINNYFMNYKFIKSLFIFYINDVIIIKLTYDSSKMLS